ncbi:hypothetical protein [Mesorhizobium opportunistum]|uniref:hypothetical protein n=1 Tax=Mesorhizobium opportunistum TaxID=593909 RepID=UPI0003CE125C|nr:hypothetical protein [Mesorhizobium opportunistum]ESY71148.1 hypothetical protein X742_01510 [Mesorhizobium sp. LNHC232B00]WJI40940.1 hypothetical protein NL534_12125 [Mesorhizobium opportunistum]
MAAVVEQVELRLFVGQSERGNRSIVVISRYTIMLVAFACRGISLAEISSLIDDHEAKIAMPLVFLQISGKQLQKWLRSASARTFLFARLFWV